MILEKVARSLRQRMELLTENNILTYQEKLAIVTKVRPVSLGGTKSALLKRLRTDADGNQYFQIEDNRIYFGPEYKVKDYDYFLKGITQVLAETYLFPRIYSKNVFLKKGDVCIDAGANIGTMTILFSKAVGETGSVIAIEPVVEKILQKNIEVNHITNVTIAPVALYDKPGEMEMLLSDYCLDNTLLSRDSNESHHGMDHYLMRKKVPVVKLDDLVEQLNLPRVDFIKIDIEGAEELALLGAAKTLAKWKPKLTVSSYHIDHENVKQHHKLVRLLKSYNYSIHEEDETHIFAW